MAEWVPVVLDVLRWIGLALIGFIVLMVLMFWHDSRPRTIELSKYGVGRKYKIRLVGELEPLPGLYRIRSYDQIGPDAFDLYLEKEDSE